jgi:Golgi nucleoside diphosphatase
MRSRIKDFMSLPKGNFYLLLIIPLLALTLLTQTSPQIEQDFLNLNIHYHSLIAKINYGIVLDCGSSGTRIYVYKYTPSQIIEIESKLEFKIKPGTLKLTGLSSLSSIPNSASEYLAPILKFAKDNIPAEYHEKTPFFLFATAGMRMIDISQQIEILTNSCKFISEESNFYIDSCENNFRIISGELEG